MNCVIERKDTRIEIEIHGISMYEIEPTVIVIDGRPRKIGNDSDVWHVLITYRYKQYACGVVAKKMIRNPDGKYRFLIALRDADHIGYDSRLEGDAYLRAVILEAMVVARKQIQVLFTTAKYYQMREVVHDCISKW
jgi:hypothetical protein